MLFNFNPFPSILTKVTGLAEQLVRRQAYAVQKYAAFGKSFNDYRKKNSRNAAADAFSKGRVLRLVCDLH